MQYRNPVRGRHHNLLAQRQWEPGGSPARTEPLAWSFDVGGVPCGAARDPGSGERGRSNCGRSEKRCRRIPKPGRNRQQSR